MVELDRNKDICFYLLNYWFLFLWLFFNILATHCLYPCHAALLIITLKLLSLFFSSVKPLIKFWFSFYCKRCHEPWFLSMQASKADVKQYSHKTKSPSRLKRRMESSLPSTFLLLSALDVPVCVLFLPNLSKACLSDPFPSQAAVFLRGSLFLMLLCSVSSSPFIPFCDYLKYALPQ